MPSRRRRVRGRGAGAAGPRAAAPPPRGRRRPRPPRRAEGRLTRQPGRPAPRPRPRRPQPRPTPERVQGAATPRRRRHRSRRRRRVPGKRTGPPGSEPRDPGGSRGSPRTRRGSRGRRDEATATLAPEAVAGPRAADRPSTPRQDRGRLLGRGDACPPGAEARRRACGTRPRRPAPSFVAQVFTWQVVDHHTRAPDRGAAWRGAGEAAGGVPRGAV